MLNVLSKYFIAVRRVQHNLIKYLVCEFGPSSFKQVSHCMTRLSHWRIIFIKNLAVLKDQIDVILKLISAFVSAKEMPLKEMFNLQFIKETYMPSLSFFLMVEMSMGTRMIFL